VTRPSRRPPEGGPSSRPAATRSTSRRRFLAAAAALAAAPLAGCLGGGGDTPTATPTATPTETATGAQAQFPDYDWAQLTRADAVETDTITMRGFQFQPLVAKVPTGTEVTVTNDDSAGHEITVPGLDVAETLDGGQSVSLTAETAGTFDYVCEFHPPDMLGRLIVGDG